MAEFCRECFIKHLRPNQDEIKHIIMSYDDEVELCEGCGEVKPFVKCVAADKVDMHCKCGDVVYEGMCAKYDSHEITKEEFFKWFDTHCAECFYMSEVCMYGEK